MCIRDSICVSSIIMESIPCHVPKKSHPREMRLFLFLYLFFKFLISSLLLLQHIDLYFLYPSSCLLLILLLDLPPVTYFFSSLFCDYILPFPSSASPSFSFTSRITLFPPLHSFLLLSLSLSLFFLLLHVLLLCFIL